MKKVALSLRARRGALLLDVALEFDSGPVALVGPNGAGKTSLLRWIAGDGFPVETARLEVGDALWARSPGAVHVPPELRRVGYVPQAGSLFGPLSVRENVAFGVRARGASTAEARAAADRALARWDAADLAGRRPDTLSGGERQKVALARAMVTQPHVLLLDEPTAALDPGARRTLRAQIAQAAEGRPTLIVTHDVRDVRTLCTLVVVLEDGRVVQQGSADAVASDPATPFVREFFEPLRLPTSPD
ncbi:MAG: ATP-binding cassette domain-containing protein [Sandaracinaceae bacterium]